MDKCRDCKRDTHWGSGLFVNRIPADDGWLCADCQSIECCHCGELTLEYSFDDNGDAWCPDCYSKSECTTEKVKQSVDFCDSKNGEWFIDKFGSFHVNINGDQYLYENDVFVSYDGPCQSGLTPVKIKITDITE
tara:strand:+ start:975 stop:1376 length:402 start_codon:yes stop_codon:yes gene_type:complete